jgi:hypothetical protein
MELFHCVNMFCEYCERFDLTMLGKCTINVTLDMLYYIYILIIEIYSF